MSDQDPIERLRWFLADDAWRAALNHRGISAIGERCTDWCEEGC
jgi:hypothetical protein